MTTYRISELARRTGTTPGTLRYYEREGLLPAGRSAAGYRLYGGDAAGWGSSAPPSAWRART